MIDRVACSSPPITSPHCDVDVRLGDTTSVARRLSLVPMPKKKYIKDGAKYAAIVEEAQLLYKLQRLYWLFGARVR